jgi:hypothetical protein
MSLLGKKCVDRIVANVKKFQPILRSAKSRDVNESDTVVIVTDILSEVFGYDKYSDITSEYMIRSTFCDLAIKLEETIQFLIEVKAIGTDLRDNHLKQAVDYASNLGVDWIILTNADTWKIYRIIFGKPIDFDLVAEFSLLYIDLTNEQNLQILESITKEGCSKSILTSFYERRQALSRFYLGSIVLSNPVVDVIRRELRRVTPDIRVEINEIKEVLRQEVLKRDVLEGEKADLAKKILEESSQRALRVRKKISEIPADVVLLPAENDNNGSEQEQN